MTQTFNLDNIFKLVYQEPLINVYPRSLSLTVKELHISRMFNTKWGITLIWNLSIASVKIDRSILRIKQAIWKHNFVYYFDGCEGDGFTRKTVFREITLTKKLVRFCRIKFKSTNCSITFTKYLSDIFRNFHVRN